jgi:hypothetical protein
MNRKALGQRTVFALVVAVVASGLLASDGDNVCDVPGEEPDLTLGDLSGPQRFATIEETSAYGIATTSCNIGSCGVNWFHSTPAHPVFTQNLYRLEDGRFEQLGMSWVTHRFFALSQIVCETGCIPTDGTQLGVHCSSPNTAGTQGSQSLFGPRSEVNATTGQFPFPHGAPLPGNNLSGRLQVAHADLDPVLHPTALFFYEGHTVAADDAAAGNGLNNLSYRQVLVSAPTFNMVHTGPTVAGQPALHAWKALDPEVRLEPADVAQDGRFWVASRATDAGGGLWHYEYAIHNLSSHRSAASVTVPLPAGVEVSNVGFHDVDYHSGEAYDGTDWSTSVGSSVVWETSAFDVDPSANALRWGTVYNFRFDAAAPPGGGALTIGLYRPGNPDSVPALAVVPMLCDLDAGPDTDGDLYVVCEDCNDTNPVVWSQPGVVGELTLERGPHEAAVLSWPPPVEPGAAAVTYEVIRASGPQGTEDVMCLELADPADTTASDGEALPPGGLYVYRVRAVNGCPAGVGPLAEGGGAAPPAISCSEE